MNFWEVLLLLCIGAAGSLVLLTGAVIWWSHAYERQREARERSQQLEVEREVREHILAELEPMFWDSADEHVH